MENSSNFLSSEDATLKRILTNPSVEGIILTNDKGQPQYTSLDNNVTFSIISKLFSFAALARATIRDIDPADNLLTFRIRTREKEMMVVTPDDGMHAIAIQKINPRSSYIRRQTDTEYDDDF